MVLAAACVLLACSGRPSTKAAVKTTSVDLPKSYQFAPANIEVARGATVTWTNHDNFSHSVQVDGTGEIHVMKPGEQAQVQFLEPGRHSFVCTFHSQQMRGEVIVDP
jgi:plastocyanin